MFRSQDPRDWRYRPLLNSVGRDIYTLAVYGKMPVGYKLSCLASCKGKTHSVYNIVKSGFKNGNEVVARLAFHFFGDLEKVAEAFQARRR